MAEERASLNPSSFTEGGGLLDGVEGTWKECRFTLWDYNGKIEVPGPALMVTLDVGGEETVQYFSAGSAKEWAPAKDGKTLVKVGAVKGLSKSSNIGILLNSLLECGFPPDKMTDDCTVFEGMITRFARIEAPKRAGLEQKPRKSADGTKEYAPTNLVVAEIVRYPWDAPKAGAGGGKKAAGGKAAAAPAADDTVTAVATEKVMEVLMANPDGLAKKDLIMKVFQACTGDPNRAKITAAINSDEFLSAGPWSYEGGKVAMA